jgi:competence protein ComEA
VTLLPPPSPAPLMVHVSGAVAQPGVYTLPAGSRVKDTIQAAGSFLAEADEGSLNLAAELEDGIQIVVQSRQPTPLPTVEPTPITRSGGASLPTPRSSPTPKDQKININTATQEELESLPLIGPVRAKLIINYRTSHGPFKKIEDVINVPEIESYIFELIKDLITV